GSRRGQSHHRRLGKQLAQLRQLAILGTKIVSPLADAVRFVDGYLIYVPASQIGQKTGEHQALRRDIEQLVFSIAQALHTPGDFTDAKSGIKKRGRDAAGLKRIHLILHQRNQRRHHDGQSFSRQRRQLKTERLATTRRQQREHIAARQSTADDLLLQRPKRIKAEGLFE